MRVDKVKDEQIYYVCKNCGKEEVVNVQQLEKNNNASKHVLGLIR